MRSFLTLCLLAGVCLSGYFGRSWQRGRERDAAVAAVRSDVEAHGWSRRQFRDVAFRLPPRWERRFTGLPEGDDAVYADGASASPPPPTVIVDEHVDPKGRPLADDAAGSDEANRPSRPGYRSLGTQAGNLPCGWAVARSDSVFELKGARVRQREWAIDLGGGRRVAVSGSCVEADWAAFEPVLDRIAETFGPAAGPSAGVPVTAKSDAEVREAAKSLAGSDAGRARSLRGLTSERGGVWLRACELWAAAKARTDAAAEVEYREALMVLAFIEPEDPSLDGFGADNFKTAGLKAGVFDAARAFLAAGPADDDLRPVLDGLHLIARRGDPGVTRRLMAARESAPDARARQVAEYAVQAWVAGKLYLLQGEAERSGGVFDSSPRGVAPVIDEILDGGEVAAAQIAEAVPRLRESAARGDAAATAELSVLVHIQSRSGPK